MIRSNHNHLMEPIEVGDGGNRTSSSTPTTTFPLTVGDLEERTRLAYIEKYLANEYYLRLMAANHNNNHNNHSNQNSFVGIVSSSPHIVVDHHPIIASPPSSFSSDSLKLMNHHGNSNGIPEGMLLFL